MSGKFPRYLIIWVLLVASVWIGDRFIRGVLLTADGPRAVTARGELADFEAHTIELFEQTAPSVAYIFTETTPASQFDRRGGTGGGGGTGSGFIWDAAGHVVTNFHVIEGARRVRVRLDSGEAVDARVIGTAPDHDLAVLQLADNRARLRPIPLGTSADLKVGQAVFAIGNPFGLSRTLTTGIISALDRRLTTSTRRRIAGVIQIDAAINPGNSGGPLLDSGGRLIGVNTAIISDTGSSAGIGFAVPVDTVNRIVPQLIRHGKAPRPGIGVVIAGEATGARLGIDGLIVADIVAGGAADRAGLVGVDRRDGRLGDVITHVNGEPVLSIAEFVAALHAAGIGNQVELTVRRGGRSRAVALRVMDIS